MPTMLSAPSGQPALARSPQPGLLLAPQKVTGMLRSASSPMAGLKTDPAVTAVANAPVDDVAVKSSPQPAQAGPNDGIDELLLRALQNPRDRSLMLRLDAELERFMNDKTASRLEFPPMSSYQRLIVHRVADYFRLQHLAIDKEPGKRGVVLMKDPHSRIPAKRFAELVARQQQAPKKVKILMRKGERQQAQETPKPTNAERDADAEDEAKMLEKREEEYAKARARIFEESKESEEVAAVPAPLPKVAATVDEEMRNGRGRDYRDIGPGYMPQRLRQPAGYGPPFAPEADMRRGAPFYGHGPYGSEQMRGVRAGPQSYTSYPPAVGQADYPVAPNGWYSNSMNPPFVMDGGRGGRGGPVHAHRPMFPMPMMYPGYAQPTPGVHGVPPRVMSDSDLRGDTIGARASVTPEDGSDAKVPAERKLHRPISAPTIAQMYVPYGGWPAYQHQPVAPQQVYGRPGKQLFNPKASEQTPPHAKAASATRPEAADETPASSNLVGRVA